MQNNPLTGFAYLMDGFALIRKPGLKRFVIIPLLINTILFVGLFFLMRYFFGEFDHWLQSYLPWWLKWVGSVLWIVFFIGFLLVMVYTFVMFANLLCAPFNSLLAEKVEIYLTGKASSSLSGWQSLKDTPRILGRQLALIGYYLPRAALLLILFFIPIIQIAATLFWFLFNAWMMSIQYLDYPADNHRTSFAWIKENLHKNRWTVIGFGSSVLILSMIPILNFIIMPAAVAGATKMWINENS